jgi:4-hydroxybenzoate polyprenyltransferase
MVLKSLKNYFILMRWHRPLPILLSLWPTYWGLFLGAKPSIILVIIFTLGVVIMRAAGCVANDIFDKKIDQFVARTAERPLAAGYVSTFAAWVLLGFLLILACSLLFFLNTLAQVLALPALLLAFAYPLAKRFTYFPQVLLGLAFNFGLIMAYAAVNNALNNFVFGLYALAVMWTLFYDTVYSLMDYPDDKRLRVKSPATFFDGRVYAFLLIIALLLLVGGTIVLHKLHIAYAAIFFLVLLFLLLRACWQVLKLKLLFLLPMILLRKQMPQGAISIWNNPALCPNWSEALTYQKIFNEQHWFGFVIFLMIIARYLGA